MNYKRLIDENQHCYIIIRMSRLFAKYIFTISQSNPTSLPSAGKPSSIACTFERICDKHDPYLSFEMKYAISFEIVVQLRHCISY